ncbi:MAG: TonB-dependent receptor [Opitutaceae bacterium]|jgi:iron complex outermembrane receptor protein|nr:TonB-dependent receptor [Opitutaceae bacterium]
MLTTILPPWHRLLRPILSGLAALAALLTLSAADAVKMNFDLPAGPAGETLKAFARQAGREIVFAPQVVEAVNTQPVRGELEPKDALDQMLADTGLAATQDARTGAFAVRKETPVESKNGSSRLQTQAANRAEETGEKVTLEKYTVTGSRITRLEGEGPQPTAAYAPTDISARGFMNLGDFVQSLSFNSGTANSIGVPAANPVSNVPFARGAVTMNPRGLGANRFLVLLDGRRPSAYGLADNRGGSVFDFNSIPAEAIASIEYLKDGGSAIYGSDAIAGVMNIRLKQNYDGVSVNLLAGNTLGHDTFTNTASLLTGGTTEKGSYLFNVNWFRQNGNFAMDYDRSQSTDYSAFPAPRGQNNNSNSNWPFNLTLTAAQATAAGYTGGAGGYVITGGVPTATPTLGSFSRAGTNLNTLTNANRYDFAPATQLTPNQENFSALLSLKHRFSETLTGFAQILVNKNRTGIVYTPISINSRSIRNADNSFLTIPANNPFNPFGFALDDFRGRGNFGPLRTFDVESTGGTLILGLEGRLASRWDWTASFLHSESVVDQLAGNQVRTSDMQAALNGTLAGFNGRFFNPFGPSDPALTQSLFVTSTSNSKSITTGIEVSASGKLFAMPALAGQRSAGDVALAVGAEWRKDELDNNSDPVGYLVTVGDLPYAGSRTVKSAYAELVAPVLPKLLTLQLAGRFDEYDSFGSTVNPKLALVSQPFSFLKIRASYSRTFKAPEIGQLFQPALTTFTTAISDPLNPGLGLNTYPFIASGNRNLEPEKGRVWYGGVVVDLNRLVKGLSVSADYFNLELDNVITTFTTPTVFFSLFPQRVIRNSAGVIQYFDASTINAAGYRWRGADFGLDYKLPGTPWGDFALSAQATYIDHFALNAGSGAGFVNTAGRYNNPRVAGSGQVTWRRGRLGASLGAQHKGSYLMDQFAPAWVEGSETLYNGSVTFDAPWRTRITVGCNNLLDTNPPQNGKAIPSYGFDIATYAAWSMGRFVYVKVKKDF